MALGTFFVAVDNTVLRVEIPIRGPVLRGQTRSARSRERCMHRTMHAISGSAQAREGELTPRCESRNVALIVLASLKAEATLSSGKWECHAANEPGTGRRIADRVRLSPVCLRSMGRDGRRVARTRHCRETRHRGASGDHQDGDTRRCPWERCGSLGVSVPVPNICHRASSTRSVRRSPMGPDAHMARAHRTLGSLRTDPSPGQARKRATTRHRRIAQM